MRKLSVLLFVVLSLLMTVAIAAADINPVTPSTNDINKTNNWAHFNVLDTRIGEADIQLVSTRTFYSCFEYRADGDTSQSVGNNPNPSVTDGRYPYICVNNSTATFTVEAQEYIEIRMVFGAEADERFDWTRVDVLPDAQTKDDCKNGGWANYGFANQGQCIRFVNTGHDSRP